MPLRLTCLSALPALGLVLLAACSGDSPSTGVASDLGGAAPAAPAVLRAKAACDRYASPHASREGSGSRARPYQSLERLVRSLGPGQVGCLMPGRFRHGGVVRMDEARTTIRSLGRPRATIDGAVWVMPGARGARIAGLNLTSHDSEFSIPLKVQADGVKLLGNDISAARSISCVLVGSTASCPTC